MASTYSTNLKIEIMATGENSGTWGTITNTNLGTALEQAIVGYGNPSFASDANLTLTYTDTNAAQAARALVLNVTSAVSLTGTRELVVPTIQKQYIVQNNTTGGQSITVKTSGGTGITVPNGRKAHLYVDGTNVIQMFDFVDINGGAIDGTTVGASSASTGAFTTLTASGATTLNGAVALGDAAADLITVPGTVNSNVIFTDNTFDIGASGATRPRTGYFGTSVLSPLVTATNLQVTNIKANDGTAVAVLTDSTGALDISKAVTFSATTQNISLGASQTTGTFVLGGTAATGAITLDASTKTHTLNVGSGATENALTKTINIGTGGVSGSTTTITIGSSDGTTTTFNGTVNVTTLDLTNLEVTNIKAKDGSASITLADSTGVASFTANPILSGGTANGVVYLNASKVATTGSALSFDGSEIFKNSGGTIQNNDVRGSAAAGTRLSAGGTLGVDSFDLFQNALAGYVFNRGNTPIIFGANNTEWMRLTSTGTLNIVGAGTAGTNQAISFNGSTPVDTLVTTSAGYVGIKTGSPDNLLTAQADATGASFADNGVAQIIARGNTDSTKRLGLGIDTTNNVGVIQAQKFGTGTYPLAINPAGGDVGIGTSSPTQKLTLVNNAASTFLNTTDNTVNTLYGTSTGLSAGLLGTLTNHPLVFYANNGEKMRLSSSGNLGIGTNSIFGVLNFQTGTNARFEFTSASTVGTLEVLNNARNAYLDYDVYALTHRWRKLGSIAMTLDSSGNLGLGVTPSAWDATAKALQIGTFVALANYTDYLELSSNVRYDGSYKYLNTGSAASSYAQNAGKHLWFTAASGTAGNVISFTQAMTLDASGNLVVGTTSSLSPTAGAREISVQSSLSAELVLNCTRTGGLKWDIASGSDNSAGTGFLAFYDATASAERMRLDSSGNLGLGVTTLSPWNAGHTAMQIAFSGAIHGSDSGNNLLVNMNAYFDSVGAFRYIQTGFASSYEQNIGQHRWSTAPSGTAGDVIGFTQAMTLDANGNLVVGATSAPSRVTVAQGTTPTDFSTVAVMVGGTGADSYAVGAFHNIGFLYDPTSSAKPAVAIGHVITSDAGATKGALVFATRDVTTDTAPTERARITSGGNLLVGTQTDSGARCTIDAASATNAVNIALPSYDYFGISIHNKATSNDNCFIAFGTEASFTTRGTITYNRAGGLVAYNTTSDYRAKDITGPVVESGATIDALKVYNGKMKGATVERPMLIAHEAQAVTPYAVTGEKDAVNDDGTPKYQQMDVSSLVPLLIAEIQSLRARVAQLEQGA